jgi:nicotinamidase-related amidase
MTETKEGAAGRAGSLKQAYVSRENLEEKAASWLKAIAPYTRHPFDRQQLGNKPALLVLDMQRFFVDEGSGLFLPAAPAILPRIRGLLDAFRARGLPIFFTRHRDRPSHTKGAMVQWWGRLMREEDPLNMLHPSLDLKSREILTFKSHYSAFLGTRLENLLNQLRVTSTVVAGVMTHLCCESTARDAFMRGFNVIVVADAMATLDETLHVSSLRGLAHGFASPALAKDIRVGLAS